MNKKILLSLLLTLAALLPLQGGATTPKSVAPGVSSAISSIPVPYAQGGTASTSVSNNFTNAGGIFSLTQPTHDYGTATSVPIISTDIGQWVTHEATSAVAVTLPQAGSLGFTNGQGYCEINNGTSTVVITPTLSLINAKTSLTLFPGQFVCPTSNGSTWNGLSSVPLGNFYIPSGSLLIGTATPVYSATIEQAGSSNSSPAVYGFDNATGPTVDGFFGDNADGFINPNGHRQQLFGYWGIEIHGHRLLGNWPTGYTGGFSTDPSLSVFGATADSAPVLQLLNSAGTTILDTVDQTGNLILGGNSSSPQAGVDDDLGTFLVRGGSAPTIGSCGTSPTVPSGSTASFTFTAGGGVLTSCTISWTWSTAPKVVTLQAMNSVAALQSMTGAYVSGISTSTLTITGLNLTGAAYGVHSY